MVKVKTRIIFVHGIGGKPPKARHLREWQQALDIRDPTVGYSMAYWADLRTPGSLTIPTKKEARELVGDVLSPIQRKTLAHTDSYRKRFLPFHERILAFFQDLLLSASEPLVRVILDRLLDDVYDYFYRTGMREQIMRRVENEWVKALNAQETPILVTHSLGTVIGLDVIQFFNGKPLPLFITMGSPLGSEWIQSRLKSNDFPRNVARWVNVYDPVDIVTRPDQMIRNDFREAQLENYDLRKSRGVEDYVVGPNTNQRGDPDPHHWYSYLRSTPVRSAVEEYLHGR